MIKKAKTVLCVDLCSVLINFDARPIEKIVKKEMLGGFISLFHQADKGLLEPFDLYCELAKNNRFFKRRVSLAEFMAICASCFVNIHTPMFMALRNLKEMGLARLVCITDINPFFFYLVILKFPEAAWLFEENGRNQWALSYKLRSLKREFNPFVFASSNYGFSREEACFVDDKKHNHEAAQKTGFAKDACFLYKLGDSKNHAAFLKFLGKHFSPLSID